MQSTFDELLATTLPDKRAAIERVRTISKKVVPSATEGTSYGMSALFYKEKPFISCMPTKKGLSIYPFSGKVIAKLEDKLKAFEGTPGSIHFSVEHELSEELLKEVIICRLQEIEEKVSKA